MWTKSVIKDIGSATCCKESQTSETSAGAKGKVYLGSLYNKGALQI